MPIFELDRAFTVQSHVLKFGSDWLSIPRVIVVANKDKKKKKKKLADATEDNTFGKILFRAVITQMTKSHKIQHLKTGQHEWLQIKRKKEKKKARKKEVHSPQDL